MTADPDLTGPYDDLLVSVEEIAIINRIIREGLAAWDVHQVIRARLAAVEREDSPAPRHGRDRRSA